MSGFFKDFFLALRSYPGAIMFIYRHKLYLYFIFPLALSLLILWAGYGLKYNLLSYNLGKPASIRELIWSMTEMLLLQTLIYLALETRKYIVIVVLSPVMYKLSYRTEELLAGNIYDGSWQQYWKDTKRALRIIFGNFVVQYGLSLIWIILALILPPLRVFTPGILLALGFYFYGFSFMDYINERYRRNINDSVDWVRKHAGFAIGIGSVFSLMFLIPFEIGVTIATPLAVVASTLGLDVLEGGLSNNPYARKKQS